MSFIQRLHYMVCVLQRAKGDVKKKGQLAPYAYIPLKRELLNKRKKTQHLKHWKNKSK